MSLARFSPHLRWLGLLLAAGCGVSGEINAGSSGGSTASAGGSTASGTTVGATTGTTANGTTSGVTTSAIVGSTSVGTSTGSTSTTAGAATTGSSTAAATTASSTTAGATTTGSTTAGSTGAASGTTSGTTSGATTGGPPASTTSGTTGGATSSGTTSGGTTSGSTTGGAVDSGTNWPIIPNQKIYPTVATPNIVIITYTGDPNQSVLNQYGVWIADGGYLSTVASQYGVGDGTVAFVSLDPTVYPTPTGGTLGTSFDLPTYLQGLLDAGALPSYAANNIYALLIPSSWVDTGSFCSVLGAFHSNFWTYVGGHPALYAAVPNCNGGASAAGQQREIELLLSHEIVEAATDPLTGTGYQLEDPSSPWYYIGGELADLCQSNTTVVTSGSFVAELIWSDQAVLANDPPCQPWNAATTYFGLIAPTTLATGAAGTQVQIDVTGWSSLPSSSSIGIGVREGDYAIDFATSPQLSASTITPGASVTVTLSIPASARTGQHGAAWVYTSYGATMVAVTVE